MFFCPTFFMFKYVDNYFVCGNVCVVQGVFVVKKNLAGGSLSAVDLSLSCSLFTEGGIKKYYDYSQDIDGDMRYIIHEWNCVLIDLFRDSKYVKYLGPVGKKLVAHRGDNFVPKCCSSGHDVVVQSLHYTLRFQENVRYLKAKYADDYNIVFCDLGCGLSPLAVVFQTVYDLDEVYCIDIAPEIAELYVVASNRLLGKSPTFIDWAQAQKLARSGVLNTVSAVGCLPQMPISEQKKYMCSINENFRNFFIETKYKQSDRVPNPQNAFSLSDLMQFRMEVSNISDIEMAMIAYSLRYNNRFIREQPKRIEDFLRQRSRSLFLSR